MSNIKRKFDKVLCLLKDKFKDSFDVHGNLLRPGPKPKFSDLHVLALSAVSETMGHDSERHLFDDVLDRDEFPNLLSRTQYNFRRKALNKSCKFIQQSLAKELNRDNDVFAADSTPLPNM